MQRSLPLAVLLALLVTGSALAQDDNHLSVRLRGFDEVPAISTTGRGLFEAEISEDDDEINYTLSYPRLQGQITQAHIHIAQEDVNGAIVIFLCSNLGNGPAGTQACPAAPGTIHGTIHSSDVIAATAQGIFPGELSEVLRAIRAGVAYVNVHTTLFPGGEIRGQLGEDDDD